MPEKEANWQYDEHGSIGGRIIKGLFSAYQSNGGKGQPMKRVLLVDDDDAMLFAFRKLCESSKVSAETADSLESALWRVSHERYDILISDLNLSGASGQQGYEIVRAAKHYNPSIRAYIWTAYDEKMLHDKVVESGVEAYLIKPIKFDDILAIINADSPTHI
jgi:CheY-like chemotaxis protein